MQVSTTGIEAQLGNNGINLRIANNSGKLVGTLTIGKARVEWRPAKAKKSFKRQRLEDFIAEHLDGMPEVAG